MKSWSFILFMMVLPVRSLHAQTIACFTIDDIRFDLNSAVLDDSGRRTLNGLAELMLERPDYFLEVWSFTNISGIEAKNNTLAQKRCDVVIDYLTSKGLPRSRILGKPYGAHHPIASERTPAGAARNRRVEFKVTLVKY